MKLVRDIYFPDEDVWMAEEYAKGVWQKDTVELALSFCSRIHTTINAGAHVGLMARALSEVSDQVMAFEPTPSTYECLVRNCKEIPNIHCYQMGLGEKPCTASIKQDTKHEANTGGNYLVEGGGDCTIVTVDSFELVDLDLLYLDVEGGEYFVLKGASKTIEECSPVIVVEEKPRLMARLGVAEDAISKYLGKFGYVRAAKNRRDMIYTRR